MIDSGLPSAVQFSRHGSTGVIRLSNPKQRNPLSRDVLRSIGDHVESCAMDQSCKNLVFTGSEETFAAGADIREIAGLNRDEALEFARFGQEILGSIRDFKGRTIAAINGFCIGGGLDLALSCSHRIAAPGATFAHPGVKLGIITGWGGTQLLPRLVGLKNAYRILLTGEAVDAEEALFIGLVDEISEDPFARAFEDVEG